ncbi:MAG: cysteine--tRNA ligase [bacterium]|nr:cysteine--tRNA ligase [bacterium]
MIKIYNTLTEKKETLRKTGKRPLKLFVCGPTVYDHPHIGNARTFVMFDLFVKYLRHRGREVFYLQNITDIDDRIIIRAQEQKTTSEKIAREYEALYFQYMKDLKVTAVNKYARATDYIPQIISQVKILMRKGHAYKIEGDGIYFDLTTFPDYGKLAHRTVADANAGISRIDESSKKRNTGDFCLWKFSKPGEPKWASELGAGRPGWHIEDTAISDHFFGPQYDVHGGALDLKFPHHEAEIAQQESASGKKPFVKIWMHAGFLDVNGQKMSKSLGNFITVPELLKTCPADVFRMAILSHHYRSPMDFTKELIETAKKNLYSFGSLIAKLERVTGPLPKTKKAKVNLKAYEKNFWNALDDDFNTPKAIAVLFDLINEINKALKTLSREDAEKIKAFLISTLKVFSIDELLPKVPPQVVQLSQRRELFRRSKQFVQSDELRKQIEVLGYVVEDTPQGPLVLPKI